MAQWPLGLIQNEANCFASSFILMSFWQALTTPFQEATVTLLQMI